MPEELAAKKSDSRVVYFLVGFGLGSLISVLCVPKSGDETRELLSERLKVGSKYTHKKAHELRERAATVVEHGKNMVTEIAAAVDVGRKAYKQEMTRAKAAGTATKN